MSSHITPVFTADAAPPAGPYSQAVKANGLIFCSGNIPADKDGNLVKGTIEENTHAVFKNIISILKAANSDLSRVVKTTVFLDDMANFARMNAVYGTYFSTHKPARSCVAAKELPKGVAIEIEVIALEN